MAKKKDELVEEIAVEETEVETEVEATEVEPKVDVSAILEVYKAAKRKLLDG
jgi:hypothetical protein